MVVGMMEAHLVAPATEGCVVNRHIVKVHALHFGILHSVDLHPPWTTSRQAPRQGLSVMLHGGRLSFVPSMDGLGVDSGDATTMI